MARILAVALFGACMVCAQSPAFDSSGNGLLKGSDYFREVIYVVGDSAGDLTEAISLYGGISFDGNGKYSINAQKFASKNGIVQNFTVTGTYTISASGYGFLSSPVSSADTIYGLVSHGIFVGSSTENKNGFSDLFVAAPAPTSAVAMTVFKGNYAAAYFSPGSSFLSSVDAAFQLNSDGQGNLGTVNFSGYVGQGGASVITQSSTKVKYLISNGAANVTFPTPSNAAFITGTEYTYISPDGSFIFGGSPTGFDMFVGVKTGTSSGFGGTYYTAGLEENESTAASGFADLNTYYGSFSAGNGTVIGHQRLTSALSMTTLSFTYRDTYPVGSDGTYTDTVTSTQYTVGDGGLIRIGCGVGPFLGISVAVQAPYFSGPGVYLNPAGIGNAASSTPFTSGIAPGELITLFGSNLAPGTLVAPAVPFPDSLGGVQVLVNGFPAAIYYVSPGQVSVVVPYETTYSIAEIQVRNGSDTSNSVTVFVNKTAPGVFTEPVGGLGLAAALHGDYSLVTEANPAVSGETVQIYLTGLGAVVPPVVAGAAGPLNPLSVATNTITAAIGGQAATVTYQGLTPGVAALYQVNLVVPSGLTAGNNALDIAGPDAYTSEALLPIGGATAAVASPLKRTSRPLFPRRFVPRPTSLQFVH